MVTKTHRGVKMTVEIPEDVWAAAKKRAIDERSDLRAVIIEALRAHLGLGQKVSKKKGRAS